MHGRKEWKSTHGRSSLEQTELCMKSACMSLLMRLKINVFIQHERQNGSAD